MEFWLAEKYLSSNLKLQGDLFQTLLNLYTETYHRLGVWRAKGAAAPIGESAALAEHSDELMALHYNLPAALFTHFLGPTMKYSMGLWSPGVTTLEQAQRAMMDDLCDKGELVDGQRILDLGCGFGSFAVHLLRRFPNVQVTGLTLSQTQVDTIRQRSAEPGNPLGSNRFTLVQGDFNDVAFDEKFDRVLSIGVFEHVTNMPGALERVCSFLDPDGLALLHYIVYRRPLNRMRGGKGKKLIGHYIFPGGKTWFDEEIFKYSDQLQVLRNWYLNGQNYRKTLECWLANFNANLPAIRQETVLQERQLKLWDLYFRVCISVFNSNRGNFYGNGQYLLKPV